MLICITPRNILINTHNLIIGGTRIVRPSSLLHDTLGHSLKVRKVVTLVQARHTRDAVLSLLFLRRLNLLLVRNSGHVDIAEVLGLVEVLVEGIRRMDGLELFGSIFASIPD